MNTSRERALKNGVVRSLLPQTRVLLAASRCRCLPKCGLGSRAFGVARAWPGSAGWRKQRATRKRAPPSSGRQPTAARLAQALFASTRASGWWCAAFGTLLHLPTLSALHAVLAKLSSKTRRVCCPSSGCVWKSRVGAYAHARNHPPYLPLCTESLVAGAPRDRPGGRRSPSTPCHPEHFSATVLTFVVVS